jgi:FkbM family methyltransferase
MKAFVDLGAYKGAAIKTFRALSGFTPDFKIYAFEPNPYAKIHHMNCDCVVYPKAAWICNKKIPFYICRATKDSQGGSLLKEKQSGNLDKKKPIEVEAIDFGLWIKSTFYHTDTIFVKMDIEGAEFALLNKMIMDGSIGYISKLHLETHEGSVGLSRAHRDLLFDRLSKIPTLTIVNNFGEFFQ